jgi:hypothetical protein
MIRKARAVWRGSGRAGNGPVSRALKAEITLDAKLV